MSILASVYDHVDDPGSKIITISQEKYVNSCLRLAQMSTLTHKHGCVIVNPRTNEIIATGYNKKISHTKTKGICFSIHAEIDALNSIRSRKSTKTMYHMYIIRLGSPHGYFTKYSKPCDACTKYINKSNLIQKVYYSTNTV